MLGQAGSFHFYPPCQEFHPLHQRLCQGHHWVPVREQETDALRGRLREPVEVAEQQLAATLGTVRDEDHRDLLPRKFGSLANRQLDGLEPVLPIEGVKGFGPIEHDLAPRHPTGDRAPRQLEREVAVEAFGDSRTDLNRKGRVEVVGHGEQVRDHLALDAGDVESPLDLGLRIRVRGPVVDVLDELDQSRGLTERQDGAVELVLTHAGADGRETSMPLAQSCGRRLGLQDH